MSTIRATYIQHGSSAVPNITLNASGEVILASGIISSGTFSFTSGTASAPGIAVSGDADTGIYSPAANKIAVTTNGTERLIVDDTGKVGLGTSNPDRKLEVVDTAGSLTYPIAVSNFTDPATDVGAAIAFHLTTGGNERGYIGCRFTSNSAAGGTYFAFAPNDGSTGNVERMRITATGQVGIGTTSPVNIGAGYTGLTINGSSGGTLYMQGGGTSGGRLLASNTDFYIGTVQASGSVIFQRQDGSYESARIDSSGRLLVGTSSARNYTGLGTAQLQLEGNDYPTASFGLTNNLNNVDGSYIVLNKTRGGSAGSQTVVQANDKLGSFWFQGADGTKGVTGATIDAFVDGTPGANDMPGRLVFSTTADGASSPTERMRISRGGTAGFFCDTSFDVINLATSETAGTARWFIYAMYGASAINTGTQSFGVYTNGNVVNTNNSYGSLSDIKLKENIVDANSQWDDLKALQVRNYNFKEGQTHTQIGLIAQEVELVSPGLVSESPDLDEDGNDLGTVTKSVNYSVLYMKAVKALQEAIERIEVLEAKVNSLEGN